MGQRAEQGCAPSGLHGGCPGPTAHSLCGTRQRPPLFLCTRPPPLWKDVVVRTGGAAMLLRREVEALGALRNRKQLEEAKALLQAHP